MITIHFKTPLNAEVSVPLEDPTQLEATLRRYGKFGWSSGELPNGGLTLPLANAQDFDFALIGAHPYVNADRETCVMYRGQSYKRRELAAVETKKMTLPEIVKYSRGARPTDPPHLKEGEDGGVQYVTLITFRGAGKKVERYAVPAATANAAD